MSQIDTSLADAPRLVPGMLARPRKVAVVSGSRADYGLLRTLMGFLKNAPSISLQIYVTGTHLSQRHGMTITEILADGFEVDEEIPLPLDSDGPVGLSHAMGVAVSGFGEAFARQAPDVVVVLGDRYEILAAAQAAMLAQLPIAHIHGGEASEGQIDEAIRHSLTKMAHYHFVAAEPYRARVIQMGEQPEHVFTVGAPGLDDFVAQSGLPFADIARDFHLPMVRPLLLVTYHPVTLTRDPTQGVRALLGALDQFPDAGFIFTGTNADTHGGEVAQLVEAYVERHSTRAMLVSSFGHGRYGSVLAEVDAMIGNSSSGIIEAPLMGTPTVNIGPRQQGRLRAPSIIDCAEETDAIAEAICTALSPAHVACAKKRVCVYGVGGASEKIADLLMSLPLDDVLMKRFYDLEDVT
ncbi:MAG: UDP-N-acetylglucosamine 2-epimerase [Parvibaculaceae bacterium]|nr:UDP-N-acetylglucosamine 2-epimerase [Parvibaculaceae bacterium]